MTCQAIRHQLLKLPDPSRPQAGLQAHLQTCAACREWQQRLLRLEQSIPALPVPPSTGPKVFVRRFLAGSGETPRMKERARTSRQRLSLLPAWQPRQWAYAATAAAAAMFLCLGSWALWHPRELAVVRAVTKPARPDPFVASLMQRDLRLAVAQSAGERLDVLADLADDLFQETRLVLRGARAEDLHQLVQLYEKVVQEGIVRLSRTPSLRAAERRAVVGPLADRLARVSREADHLAEATPGNAATVLRAIAGAARDGESRLRGLVTGLPGRFFFDCSSIPIATVVLLADLEENSAPADDPHQWQQLTRNRSLIEALVTSGLVLACEEDPLQRAEQCTGLARQLVDEIQDAADREDGGRAAEIGGHLHDLLRGGVVHNLDTVRDQTPPGSTRLLALRDLSAKAQRVTEPLEKRYQTLARTDAGELRRVLEAIHDTRAEVDKFLHVPLSHRADP